MLFTKYIAKFLNIQHLEMLTNYRDSTQDFKLWQK